MSDRKTYSVRLLPEIYTKLKVIAAKKGKTLSALLEEAINSYLKKIDKK